MKKSILIITTDMSFCQKIKSRLHNETMSVHYHSCLEDALDNFTKGHFCLVVFNWCPHCLEGLKVLQIMRAMKKVPILVVADSSSSDDAINALRAGADDYISKAVNFEELIARAESLIRRYLELGTEETLTYSLAFNSELIIDPQYRFVHVKGVEINLTKTEFDILYYLARHPNQVINREQIYSHVWKDNSFFNSDDTVRFHIHSLRKKLVRISNREYIKSVWGIGYRFNVSPLGENS